MATLHIGKLARLAGISVRTLHHYDAIGLLKASARTVTGYRCYSGKDAIRLQQILYYREMEMPLARIKALLDDPGFDPVATLIAHRKLLSEQARRLRVLLKTIDKTLHLLSEEDMSINERELYAGFSKAEIAAMKVEVYQRFDSDTVKLSQQRVAKMDQRQVAQVKHEQQAIAENAALLVGKTPDNSEVQALMARQLVWLENFYPVSPERFKGLGQMYLDDARFRQQYDTHAEGTAEFMRTAMAWYADHVMSQD